MCSALCQIYREMWIGNRWAPRYRDLIVQHLERVAIPELSKHIVEDFYVTPEYFRDTLSTLHGSGFSIQPTFRPIGLFPLSQQSTRHRGFIFRRRRYPPRRRHARRACAVRKCLEHVLPKN